MKQDSIPVQPHKERRCRTRFRAKEGALAFLGNIPGTIIDINEYGIALNYVVFEKEPDGLFQLDIFLGAEDFYLAHIPSELVCDIQSQPESPFCAVRVKRLGLRFRQLNKEQITRLKYFILHHSMAEA